MKTFITNLGFETYINSESNPYSFELFNLLSYQKGNLSLQEAATAASVSLYEMMDYIEREKIVPLEPSNEELEAHFKETQKLLKRSKISSK